VIDYVVVGTETLHQVKSMEIDEDGKLGGSSDHNMIVTRLADSFEKVVRKPFLEKVPGFDISDDTDWSGYSEMVRAEVGGIFLLTDNPMTTDC
jgi:hypothetical protein